MSKIARTPYNSSRWITKTIIKSTTIEIKNTGECLFINPSEEITLQFNFIDKGSYFKIILKNDIQSKVNISTISTFVGVLVYDDGVSSSGILKSETQQLSFPAGSSAGSYLDIMCDGDKWYCQGVLQGAIWDLN